MMSTVKFLSATARAVTSPMTAIRLADEALDRLPAALDARGFLLDGHSAQQRLQAGNAADRQRLLLGVCHARGRLRAGGQHDLARGGTDTQRVAARLRVTS